MVWKWTCPGGARRTSVGRECAPAQVVRGTQPSRNAQGRARSRQTASDPRRCPRGCGPWRGTRQGLDRSGAVPGARGAPTPAGNPRWTWTHREGLWAKKRKSRAPHRAGRRVPLGPAHRAWAWPLGTIRSPSCRGAGGRQRTDRASWAWGQDCPPPPQLCHGNAGRVDLPHLGVGVWGLGPLHHWGSAGPHHCQWAGIMEAGGGRAPPPPPHCSGRERRGKAEGHFHPGLGESGVCFQMETGRSLGMECEKRLGWNQTLMCDEAWGFQGGWLQWYAAEG